MLDRKNTHHLDVEGDIAAWLFTMPEYCSEELELVIVSPTVMGDGEDCCYVNGQLRGLLARVRLP